jgi:hypothetical protein
MIFAAAAVLALSASSAFAGEGEGTQANTLFTEIPGVVAQAPVQQTVPSAVARNQTGGAPIASFVTNSNHGTWVFPPNPNQGANS